MAYEFQESIQRGIVYLAKSDDNFLVQAMPMVKESYFEFPLLYSSDTFFTLSGLSKLNSSEDFLDFY